MVSTINGDANVPFYKELANQGITAEDIPVVAFSVGEEELAGIDTARSSVTSPPGTTSSPSIPRKMPTFIKAWHEYIGNDKRMTNDPMEAAYLGFNLWVQAVEKAGTTDTDAVLKAIVGLETPNLTGGIAKMLPNHHLTKPVLIGEIQADGQFEIVSSRPTSSRAMPGPTSCRKTRASRPTGPIR